MCKVLNACNIHRNLGIALETHLHRATCIFAPVAYWIHMNLICNLTQLSMD